MANTEYEKALEKARLQAMGAGVNPDNIDPNYARALSNGTDTIYSQTISNSRNGLNRNTSSIENNMQELANMQRKQAIAGLERSRDNALSNLEGEESSIKPMYYDKRNQANVQNKIGAKNFAEFMANRGTRNSGENSQGRLMQNLGLQNALTDINTQEQSALNDIARRRTGINNAYESDLAGVNAGIEAQSLQNQIAQMQRQQDIAREDSRYNKEFDYRLGRDNISDQRYADEIEWQRSADNPAMKSQILGNQIAELELANLPEMQRLQLQQLRKQIANIGRSPSRTPQQIEMDNITLEMAREELKQMQNTSKPSMQQTISGMYPNAMLNPMLSQPSQPKNKTEEDLLNEYFE